MLLPVKYHPFSILHLLISTVKNDSRLQYLCSWILINPLISDIKGYNLLDSKGNTFTCVLYVAQGDNSLNYLTFKDMVLTFWANYRMILSKMSSNFGPTRQGLIRVKYWQMWRKMNRSVGIFVMRGQYDSVIASGAEGVGSACSRETEAQLLQSKFCQLHSNYWFQGGGCSQETEVQMNLFNCSSNS